MGDSAAIPWRLLDINILVEDPETGGMLSYTCIIDFFYLKERLTTYCYFSVELQTRMNFLNKLDFV